ncbi:MAG: peptide chain release factor N(5)-glutamine methyltransferase [Myxococcales bacterium]
MAETWTIQRVLTWTSEYFERRGIDSPRLTAELLLAHALGCDRVRLFVDFDRPLNKDELATFRGFVERRASGEPTYYITGRREFYGRPFQVDPRVLIPRPETEHLVDAALERLAEDARGPVLDLCTGSGAVAVSLAAEREALEVVATDISEAALEVAALNARALGVEGRVELLRGDLYEPVAGRTFEMIVANPPYVRSGEIDGLSREVRREPRGALDGGPDGLDVVRRIAAQAPGALRPGGWLLLEIGAEQGEATRAILEAAGLVDAQVRKDLAGLDRIALARRP